MGFPPPIQQASERWTQTGGKATLDVPLHVTCIILASKSEPHGVEEWGRTEALGAQRRVSRTERRVRLNVNHPHSLNLPPASPLLARLLCLRLGRPPSNSVRVTHRANAACHNRCGGGPPTAGPWRNGPTGTTAPTPATLMPPSCHPRSARSLRLCFEQRRRIIRRAARIDSVSHLRLGSP